MPRRSHGKHLLRHSALKQEPGWCCNLGSERLGASEVIPKPTDMYGYFYFSPLTLFFHYSLHYWTDSGSMLMPATLYTTNYWLQRHVDACHTICYYTNCTLILTSCFISLVPFYSMCLDVRLAQLTHYVTYFPISLTFKAHYTMA